MIWLLVCLWRPVLAIQIFAGTSKLGGSGDTCGNIQEFSCINDICDPDAGSADNGRCRNGDDSGGTCAPSTQCSTPTPGHCLENTISAPGLHGMPSNKHFYCVNVLDLIRQLSYTKITTVQAKAVSFLAPEITWPGPEVRRRTA